MIFTKVTHKYNYIGIFVCSVLENILLSGEWTSAIFKNQETVFPTFEFSS